MKQRLLVAVAAGVAVGMGLAVVFGGSLFGFGDRETDVTLSSVNGTCEVGKATLVRVRQSQNLKWEIENYCTDGEKIVMVGNFRTAKGPSGATNCNAAGPQFPFTDADQGLRTATLAAAQQDSNGRIDATDGDIKLKAKGRDDLPQDTTYYFDLCVNGAIVDPMLIVER